MKRVVVTGASGMIGASLIEQLTDKGIQVVAIIRPGSKKADNIISHKLVNVIECNITELLSLQEKLSHDYDTFYHFAWDGTYGNSRDDVFLQEQNVRNTLDAVKLAHTLNCKVFVGAGSQAEFGYVRGVLSDNIPKDPVTGYGIAKYMAGRLSALLCQQYGIRHSWGRIVSSYGPRDNSYTMVMSSIIGMLRGQRMQFTKAEQIWDYLYVDDCARAFYLIGERGKHGKAYTVASGENRPLLDFILDIRDTVNPDLDIGIGEIDYFPNQVMELRTDITDLVLDTGFCPAVSFEEGIRKTMEWVKQADTNHKNNSN